MTFDHTQLALSRIAWQYRNGPVFQQWIETLPGIGQTELETPLNDLLNVLDIDNAASWQLDIIGSIVNQPRVGVLIDNDDFYRSAIRARIAKNNSDVTIDGVFEAIRYIVGDTPTNLLDNQDMTFTFEFPDGLSPLLQLALVTLDLIPRPQAVKIVGLVIPQGDLTFGFEYTDEPATDGTVGFGELGLYELDVGNGDILAVNSAGDIIVFNVNSSPYLLDVPEGGQFAELI